MFISIAIYPVIRSYDEQAFNNVSEESERKKTLSLRNRCGLFQVKAWLSRPENMAVSDPREVTQETPLNPESEVAEDHLMKDVITYGR